MGTPLARKFHFAARAEAEERCARRIHAGAADPTEGECGEDGEEEPVHPAEVEPALFAGMRLHTAPVAHKFGRFVISMIALSAVLSALSGYLYSRAAVRSSTGSQCGTGRPGRTFPDELAPGNGLELSWWDGWRRPRTITFATKPPGSVCSWPKKNPALLSQKDAMDQVQQRQQSLEKFEKKEPEAHKLMTGELGPEQDVHFP